MHPSPALSPPRFLVWPFWAHSEPWALAYPGLLTPYQWQVYCLYQTPPSFVHSVTRLPTGLVLKAVSCSRGAQCSRSALGGTCLTQVDRFGEDVCGILLLQQVQCCPQQNIEWHQLQLNGSLLDLDLWEGGRNQDIPRPRRGTKLFLIT